MSYNKNLQSRCINTAYPPVLRKYHVYFHLLLICKMLYPGGYQAIRMIIFFSVQVKYLQSAELVETGENCKWSESAL